MQLNMPSVVQWPVRPEPEPEPGRGEALVPLAGVLNDGVTLATVVVDSAVEVEVIVVDVASGLVVVVVDVAVVTVRNPVDEVLVLEVRLSVETEEVVEVELPAVPDEPAPVVMLKYTPVSEAPSRATRGKLFMMPWLLAVAAMAIKAATMVCGFVCMINAGCKIRRASV